MELCGFILLLLIFRSSFIKYQLIKNSWKDPNDLGPIPSGGTICRSKFRDRFSVHYFGDFSEMSTLWCRVSSVYNYYPHWDIFLLFMHQISRSSIKWNLSENFSSSENAQEAMLRRIWCKAFHVVFQRSVLEGNLYINARYMWYLSDLNWYFSAQAV